MSLRNCVIVREPCLALCNEWAVQAESTPSISKLKLKVQGSPRTLSLSGRAIARGGAIGQVDDGLEASDSRSPPPLSTDWVSGGEKNNAIYTTVYLYTPWLPTYARARQPQDDALRAHVLKPPGLCDIWILQRREATRHMRRSGARTALALALAQAPT